MARSAANIKNFGMARGRKKPDAPTAYSVMWVVVMFDLPVGGKAEMRRAARFRNSLLELGFTRCVVMDARVCSCPQKGKAARRMPAMVFLCRGDNSMPPGFSRAHENTR